MALDLFFRRKRDFCRMPDKLPPLLYHTQATSAKGLATVPSMSLNHSITWFTTGSHYFLPHKILGMNVPYLVNSVFFSQLWRNEEHLHTRLRFLGMFEKRMQVNKSFENGHAQMVLIDIRTWFIAEYKEKSSNFILVYWLTLLCNCCMQPMLGLVVSSILLTNCPEIQVSLSCH